MKNDIKIMVSSSFVSRVKDEAFIASTTNSGGRVELDLSDWLSYLAVDGSDVNQDKINDLLSEAIEGFDEVSLTLQRLTTTSIPKALCQCLNRILVPKLVSLSFIHCATLNMTVMAALFAAKDSKIRRIAFTSCGWVNDSILEQISIRCNQTLKEIHFEGLKNITNKGMYEIGRRCSGNTTMYVCVCERSTFYTQYLLH